MRIYTARILTERQTQANAVTKSTDKESYEIWTRANIITKE